MIGLPLQVIPGYVGEIPNYTAGYRSEGSGVVSDIDITAVARIKGLGFRADSETTGLAGKFDMPHYLLWNRALTAEEMQIAR